MISAPDLEFFLYKGNKCLPFSTDDFHSLEKADICVVRPTDAHQVLRLLQQLHNVKSLTLNLEIVELLSLLVELMSCQSSPFANLKSLNFHQVSYGNKRIKMSAEVKSYLLDSSPGATSQWFHVRLRTLLQS
ncbi:uncharacterized protein LOC143588289 isoform X2 [Bidens hawaiensis]|uniref:uncharacterized protein LOC143588289 isoform X2 n=1 Tax=Bidens hawaiensis TaxID=980011 RepID=UPI004048EE35